NQTGRCTAALFFCLSSAAGARNGKTACQKTERKQPGRRAAGVQSSRKPGKCPSFFVKTFLPPWSGADSCATMALSPLGAIPAERSCCMIPPILVEKAGELEAAVREKFPALAPLARQCFLNT